MSMGKPCHLQTENDNSEHKTPSYQPGRVSTSAAIGSNLILGNESCLKED